MDKIDLEQVLDSLPPDVQAARNRHYGSSCLREREDLRQIREDNLEAMRMLADGGI